MTSAPTVTVEAALGVPKDTDFVLDDPTKGVLDGTTYVLASGYSTVTSDATGVTITRGRTSRLWDAMDSGRCMVILNNEDRDYDPAYLFSPYRDRLRPGRGVRISANDRPIFTGHVEDFGLDYQVSGRSTAAMAATDALGSLGQLQFDEFTASGSTVSAKLTEALDRDEVDWPLAERDFDEGVAILQTANTVSYGDNVLGYCQLLARSEIGYLFASVDGRLTFRDRNLSNTSLASFGASGIPFQGISVETGSELLFSRVVVTREGGSATTAVTADAPAWREKNGPLRSLSITGVLLSNDTQSLDLAEYLLALYDSPRYRVRELTVHLEALSSTDQNTVLELDITDMVTVEFTPNDVGDAVVQFLVVQGIRHDITPASHVVTLSLMDAPSPFFRLDSADFGVLDTDILGL